ncbi:IS110 family transposase [Variovorax sp. J22R133]|uniref:IS110 family transposase n=1 Tax=Variovorax brevis TaxID=3053503 RepID=UPI0025768FDC|nr:IS110 family transposase [Variovorax sp. J22R133]MDM0117745.1 IS110 family transposase [Variovorax sp. J22R133]
MDVHRNFAQVAILENGLVKDHGRFAMARDAVLNFGATLTKEDDVVLEATGNTAVIVRLLTPFVHRVAIANPLQVRAIACAKVKTDKIDAATLARLHAAQFLPEVWMPGEEVELQRRCIAERAQLVSQMTRLKNRIQSILHANLIPRETGRIYGKKGRARLEELPLPPDQRRVALRHHDELGRLAAELAVVDKELAQRALDDPNVKRLMTIGGVNSIVAASVLAAIGDIKRFSSPQKLVSYLGLNPSVHQSGDHPAYHGHITHRGRGHARGMLVEAAWALASAPGPLSAFCQRISLKRGKQVAAVATARKLAVLVWHMLTKNEDYAWTRPALLQWKLRNLELKAGHASRRGGNKPGPASDYSLQVVRDKERAWLGLAEQEYRRFVAAWRDQPAGTQIPSSKEGNT